MEHCGKETHLCVPKSGKINSRAFTDLAEVVLSISKDPVVTVEILDSDRHQRVSGCLRSQIRPPIKNAEKPPSRVTLAPFQTTAAQTAPYYREMASSERGRGDEISRIP